MYQEEMDFNDLIYIDDYFQLGSGITHQLNNQSPNPDHYHKDVSRNFHRERQLQGSQRRESLALTDYWALEHRQQGLGQDFDRHEENNLSGALQLSHHSWFQQIQDHFLKERQLSGPIENCKAKQQECQERNCSIKKTKNQTKNIPKNFGKAIITFFEKEQALIEPILLNHGISYEEMIQELEAKKKTVNTIAHLRQLWIDFKYAKCFRMISNLFLRKFSLNYIFNSRICNYNSHIKYRKRLQEAIEVPQLFKHIKQY